MKKNDKILIVGVLLIALAAFGFQCLRPAGDEAKLKITVDGKLFGTYRLSEEKTVKVNDTNKVLIKDGAVFMEWQIARIRSAFVIRGSAAMEKVSYAFRIK